MTSTIVNENQSYFIKKECKAFGIVHKNKTVAEVLEARTGEI